jgi:hypothetical protein
VVAAASATSAVPTARMERIMMRASLVSPISPQPNLPRERTATGVFDERRSAPGERRGGGFGGVKFPGRRGPVGLGGALMTGSRRPRGA